MDTQSLSSKYYVLKNTVTGDCNIEHNRHSSSYTYIYFIEVTMRTSRRLGQKSFGISSENLKHSSNIEHTFKSLLTGSDIMLIGLPVYRVKSKC